jgi:hypothetical protein
MKYSDLANERTGRGLQMSVFTNARSVVALVVDFRENLSQVCLPSWHATHVWGITLKTGSPLTRFLGLRIFRL